MLYKYIISNLFHLNNSSKRSASAKFSLPRERGRKSFFYIALNNLALCFRPGLVHVPLPKTPTHPRPHGDGPCRPYPGLRNERDFEKGSANSINISVGVFLCVLSLCVCPTRTTRIQCGQSFRILILPGISCCFDIMLSESSDPLRGFACLAEKNKEGSCAANMSEKIFIYFP